jgi:hypothetical protein
MKPTTKELGEKQCSQVRIGSGYRFGIKEYENGVRIAINKQAIILRNHELNLIMHTLALKKGINLYQPYLFTLLKEKFDNKKYAEIHRYINYLMTAKPHYFEENQKIQKEKQLLEEL